MKSLKESILNVDLGATTNHVDEIQKTVELITACENDVIDWLVHHRYVGRKQFREMQVYGNTSNLHLYTVSYNKPLSHEKVVKIWTELDKRVFRMDKRFKIEYDRKIDRYGNMYKENIKLIFRGTCYTENPTLLTIESFRNNDTYGVSVLRAEADL